MLLSSLKPVCLLRNLLSLLLCFPILNRMKTGKIISFFIILLYGIVCFRMNYLKDFPSEIHRTSMDKNLYIAGLIQQDKELTLLSDNAQDYDYTYINSILHSPVIADTTLRNVVFENNNYYLKAVARSDSESRILIKLKIDKKLAGQLKSRLYSNCVVIADLSSAKNLPFSKNIIDFEGNTLWNQENNDVLLEGELVNITLVGSAPRRSLPLS